jgi:trigger factor
MKVTTEELERCEVLMTIELDPAQEQEMLQKAAKRIAKEVKIPGFRPGKAPFHVVTQRVGLEAVQAEAWETEGERIITKALQEATLDPFAPLELSALAWNPARLTLKVPLRPKVELGNYRDTRLKVPEIIVTDKDVETVLQDTREQKRILTPVERPAQMGDVLLISLVEEFQGTVYNREEIQYELLPPKEEAKEQLPDLTPHLLGLSAGDHKSFLVTYPSGSESPYAGEEVTITVDIKEVASKELPALTDEFAQSLGEFETVDALREQVRTNLQSRREQIRDVTLGREMLSTILEKAEKVEWSPIVEEAEIEQELRNYERQVTQSGLTLESYLKMQSKTEASLREEIREHVVEYLKLLFVLSKIAELEQIGITKEEALYQVNTVMTLAEKDGKVDWSKIDPEGFMRGIISELMSFKVIARLAAIAKGEAPELSAVPEEGQEEVEESSTSSSTLPPVTPDDDDDDKSDVQES